MKLYAACLVACAVAVLSSPAQAQSKVEEIISGLGGAPGATAKSSDVESIITDLGGGKAPAPAAATRGVDTFDTLSKRPKTRSWTLDERETVEKTVVNKPKRDFEVTFDYNSAVITEKARLQLNDLGSALQDPRLSGRRFIFRGHTDAKGEALYNDRLSDQRADAVKKYITGHFRVEERNFQAIGNGARSLKNTANPYADENRRVEVVNWD